MMAKMRMANITSKPICISGAKALKMDLRTTWRPVEEKKDRRVKKMVIQCTANKDKEALQTSLLFAEWLLQISTTYKW